MDVEALPSGPIDACSMAIGNKISIIWPIEKHCAMHSHSLDCWKCTWTLVFFLGLNTSSPDKLQRYKAIQTVQT